MSDRRLKTEVSEIATGLGMLEFESLPSALSSRPAAFLGVGPEIWTRLGKAYGADQERPLFDAAWENGRAFLKARDGLRGRSPVRIEWKGPSRPVGYEFLPADLRVDHVFLISCKYRSRVLFNAAPAHLFDRALIVRRGARVRDWYLEVAPVAYQKLYTAARAHVGSHSLPDDVAALRANDRRALKQALKEAPWPDDVRKLYHDLGREVAEASARRWRAQLVTPGQREDQLWRLLRLGSAPYFMLGASPHDPLRLRIGTPWDWRKHFRLKSFTFAADPKAEQPVVRWQGVASSLHDGCDVPVNGFVEIRWSHGRFAQHPEAKVQLETKHESVPGYFELE